MGLRPVMAHPWRRRESLAQRWRIAHSHRTELLEESDGALKTPPAAPMSSPMARTVSSRRISCAMPREIASRKLIAPCGASISPNVLHQQIGTRDGASLRLSWPGPLARPRRVRSPPTVLGRPFGRSRAWYMGIGSLASHSPPPRQAGTCPGRPASDHLAISECLNQAGPSPARARAIAVVATA